MHSPDFKLTDDFAIYSPFALDEYGVPSRYFDFSGQQLRFPVLFQFEFLGRKASFTSIYGFTIYSYKVFASITLRLLPLSVSV